MPVHAFIFPGQGSQAVGMGRDLAAAFAAAREVFQEVDDTLSQNLSRLMFQGPGEDLTLTENTQPALMAHSLAVLRVLEKEAGMTLRQRALVVAGHSLGEYTALAAAGAFSIPVAARLLKRRGQAMQQAVPAGLGAMAALLGADMDLARTICEAAAPVPELPSAAAGPARIEVVQPANDNGAGQVVISGHRTAVERADRDCPRKGRQAGDAAAGVRAVSLCPDGARGRRHGAALEDTPPAEPTVPLVANVSAAREYDPPRIRDLLVQQVTATVRWRESVEAMTAMGVDSFIELGAGKVLTGLIRRIAPDVSGLAAGTPTEIEAVLKHF